MTLIFVKTFFVVALCLAQVFDFVAAQSKYRFECGFSNQSEWRSVRCPTGSGSGCTVHFDGLTGNLSTQGSCDCVPNGPFSANCTNGLIFTYSESGAVSTDWSGLKVNNLAIMNIGRVCRTAQSDEPLTPTYEFEELYPDSDLAIQVCFTPICTCSAPTDVPDPAGVFCPGQIIPAPTNWTSPGCPVSLPSTSLPSVPTNASCGSHDFTYNFECGNATFPVIRRVTVGDSGPIFNASTCAADGVVPSYTTTCNGTPRPLQFGYPGGCNVQATYSNICDTFKLCDDINLKASCAVS